MTVPTFETWYTDKSEAEKDAAFIQKFDTDNWTYTVQSLGSTYFVIVISDENNEFVGRL